MLCYSGAALSASIGSTCINILDRFAPYSPPRSPVRDSVSSSPLLLMKAVIRHLSGLFAQPILSPFMALPARPCVFFLGGGFGLDSPQIWASQVPSRHLMWFVRGVYSGVAGFFEERRSQTPGPLDAPASRCWSSVREPTVPERGENRGLIDEARLPVLCGFCSLASRSREVRRSRASTCCTGEGVSEKGSCDIRSHQRGTYIMIRVCAHVSSSLRAHLG